MSTYCGIRFKDVVLDLRERIDIWKWLVEATNLNNMLDDESFLSKVPKEIKDKNKIHYLPNIIYEKFDNTLELAYLGNIKLDMVVSIKNNYEDELEHLVKMLQPYIKSGDIYHNEEDDDRKVDYTSEFDVDIIDDEEYIYFNYYNKDTFTPEELLKLELEGYTNPEDYEDKLNNLDYYR